VSAPSSGPAGGLADRLKAYTRSLHRQAERSGVIARMLAGRITGPEYTLLLRNLVAAYRALESGLEARRELPVLRELAVPAVYRADSLAADLRALEGSAWEQCLPILPAAARYRERIEHVARSEPALLLAHAYTRFLGDLNGGQVLRRLLSAAPGLPPSALAFYEFPGAGSLDTLRADYRRAIDRAGALLRDVRPVLDEAAKAFRCNIEVSLAVEAAVALRA
jgi:heme oxygenase